MSAVQVFSVPWLALLFVLVGVLGCQHTDLVPSEQPRHHDEPLTATPMEPVADPLQIEAQLQTPHLLEVGDQVDIRFPYSPGNNVTQTVREDGRISAPYLDEPIVALGRTPEMVRDELRCLYGLRRYDPIWNRQEADRRHYVLHVGDALDIQFDFQPEANEHVTIRPDGRISLSRVKTVLAEGKTPQELEQELYEKFKPFMKDPSLVVVVSEATSGFVYVDGTATRLGLRNLDQLEVLVHRQGPQLIFVTGEVGNPGFFAYRPPMTTLRAIIAAGGYKRTSRLDSVIILRKVGTEQPVALKVNLLPEIEGEATTDVALRPNDVIIVPKTCIAKVQDVLDQYLYNLIPATRNVNFTFFYDFNPGRSTISPIQASGTTK